MGAEKGQVSGGGARRSDARRNRRAILAAAARELPVNPDLTVLALADAAGVSRSTLHRHFPTRSDLDRAMREAALEAGHEAIGRATVERRPPLAALREVVHRLVEVAAEHRLHIFRGLPLGDEADKLGSRLVGLAEELRLAAEMAPAPPASWVRGAAGHVVGACFELGSPAEDRRGVADAIFVKLTEPLDRGLVLLDPRGSLLSINPPAAAALAPGGEVRAGERLAEPRGRVVREDGSESPAESYPLSVAARTGVSSAPTVRGHARRDGGMAWMSVEAHVLQVPGSDSPHGVLGVLSDLTSERDWELGQLRPAGQLGPARPVPLDIARVLDEIPPHLFPEQFVSEARRITGTPVALYVLDIDGSHLLRLAGSEEFPARLEAPLSVGAELAEDGIPDLAARVESELPGVSVAPMWLRGRAVGVLLSVDTPPEALAELARSGAAAMELAGGYTDVFDAARRRKDTVAAAELQQSLLPPRIARMAGGELAGSVLPSYEVGGDWFDYVENRDGAWIAVADAVGKGPTAGALGGIALAALRGARRSQASLEAAALAMHEVIHDVGRPEFFVTALVARWHAVYSTFSWVNCGHPPPLVARRDGSIEQLMKGSSLPLGLLGRERQLTRHQRRLEAGERMILHSDGITARRTADGLFGIDGIERAVRGAPSRSAPATVRAIQEAVMAASEDKLQDDAVVVALAPAGAGAGRW